MKEIYTYGRLTGNTTVLTREVNSNKIIDIEMKTTPNGVDIYLNDKKIGFLMSEKETGWSTLVNKAPKVNEVKGSDQIIKKYGDNTSIRGRIIQIPVLRCCTIAFDEDLVVTSEETEKHVEKAKPTFILDLSSIIEKNREFVEKRIKIIKSLTWENETIMNNVIKGVINYFTRFNDADVREFTPSYINRGNEVQNGIISWLLGLNMALIGPKGVGKNTYIKHLADFFNGHVTEKGITVDIAKEELIGSNTLDKDSSVVFEASNVVKGAKRGDAICLDEVNMGNSAVLSGYHSMLDDRRYIELQDGTVVNVHENTRFFITMNEGYQGTRPLNEAFADRFTKILFKPCPDGMDKVFMSRCGLNKEDAVELGKYYSLVYNAVYTESDSAIPEEYISQRAFIRAGDRYAAGFCSSVASAFKQECVDTIQDEEVREILENLMQVYGI